MAHLRCPHCAGDIELRVVLPHVNDAGEPHSTSVRVDETEAILHGDGYRPNPLKVYRTPESQRRAGLAHYYAHREDVLRRAREKRRRAREAVSSSP